jgi:septum formation protein
MAAPTPQPFRLILASASPRRRELLTQAGFLFTAEAAHIDESQRAGEDPRAYVMRLAIEKARVVFARHATRDTPHNPLLVLGADTSVICDGRILGKPADSADAARMLRTLSGRTHQVLTGVALLGEGITRSAVETTEVTFSQIPESELATYSASPEPLDKAGAYGIQGYAARWVPRIDGCYFNVMGLPIALTARLIDEAVPALTGRC